MKVAGLPLVNSTVSLFSLRRQGGEPLQLRLRPLSLGFHHRLRARGLLPPQPPVKIARDAGGKPLRDAQGMVLSLEDRRAPEYLQAVEKYHQQVAVLSVVEALQGDPQITFETSPPASEAAADWMAYADELFTEMEQSGFTAGDLIVICREICRLSNLLDDDLRQARANFSSRDTATPG